MSKILDNVTGAPIVISDTGASVDNVTNYTIPAQDYLLWAASSDIITEIGAGNIVVNDGTSNLSISDGTDLLKDIFPKKMGVLSGDDLTPIGHIEDSLKVTMSESASPGTPVLSKKLRIDSSISTLALTASYQTVYTYTGSGKLTGFDVKFDRAGSTVKLIIDSTEVIFELLMDNLDMIRSSKVTQGVSLEYDSSKEVVTFSPRFPISYGSSILIQAKDAGGGVLADVVGYLVSLTKET